MGRRLPLIFLHIPKTAGMSLRRVLASRYRPQNTYVIGNDINADIDRFVGMDASERGRILLLMGHMGFGLHTLFSPPARYVTILRHPVDRVLSEYRFLRNNPRHPFHRHVARMSLEEYLESGFTGQSSNGQTRLLCGSHEPGRPGIPGREPLGESSVERALEHIDRHFVIAGTQERFEESLLLMAQRLRWRIWPFFIVRNVTVAARHDEATDDAARVRVAQYNRLDMALYRAVNERLDHVMAESDPRFAVTVDRFVRANGIYQGLVSRRLQYGRRIARAFGKLSPSRRPGAD